jgi:tRNA pseudouridine13 synthase
MLHYLYSHPTDYGGALLELPPKLLSMFVSAFQSYLFNCALSRRFDNGGTLTEPLVGDQLLFANGRTDSVTTSNKHAVSLHLARGRCNIALFMPGKTLVASKSDGDNAIAEILVSHGITSEDFARASAFVHTRFDGAFRPIALKTEIGVTIDNTTVRLKFSLPPGHYATTVCREFMQADPVRMI